MAAVLLGSVLSTLFAGLLADWMGRKPLMILSGCTFALSIPVIALSQGYAPLFFGRLLQGMSGGLIGVVVPLYLADASPHRIAARAQRIFQWLLTLGIVAAALIGMYFSYRVAAVAKLGDADGAVPLQRPRLAQHLLGFAAAGLLFVLGSLFVTESPRWLFRRRKRSARYAALLRSRSPEQAALELEEMEATAHAAASSTGEQIRDSLLRRKYVIPFLLACVILACNQATGINSVIGYNTSILLQSGLSDLACALGLRDLHGGELSRDHDRHDAGGSQGPQVPAHHGHVRRDRRHDRRGLAVPHDGKAGRRLPRRRAGAWSGPTRS